MVAATSSAGHADHRVVVGDDDVTGVHRDGAEGDGQVDRAGGGLHGALRGDRGGPRREAHLVQVGDIADAGVDDQAAHPTGLQGGGEQLTEQAVRGGGIGGDDEDVARGALLDGDVDHQVVAGPAHHGDRGSGGADARLDRAELRTGQADAAHRLVHRRGAETRQGVHIGQRGLLRVGDHQRPPHARTPVFTSVGSPWFVPWVVI